MTQEYRSRLTDVANDLKIPLYVSVPDGVLNPHFVSSWQRRLQNERHKMDSQQSDRLGSSANASKNLQSDNDDSEEEEDEEEEEKKKKKKKNDDKSNHDAADDNCSEEDECEEFIERILNSRQQQQQRQQRERTDDFFLRGVLPQKKSRINNRRLSETPRIGSEKKMKKFLSMKDDRLNSIGHLALEKQFPPSPPPYRSGTDNSRRRKIPFIDRGGGRGGGMVTRSRALLADKATENGQGGEERRRTNKRTISIDDVMETRTPKKKKATRINTSSLFDAADTILNERESLASKTNISFRESCILIVDDALFTKTQLRDGDDDLKKKRSNYLKTLEFINHLCLELAHHMKIHVVIISQSNLTGNGNNYISSLYKSIKTNIDTFILFQQSLADIRNFLLSLGTGQTYRILKEIYLQAIEYSMPETVHDARVSRPYIMLNMGNSSNRNLRFR